MVEPHGATAATAPRCAPAPAARAELGLEYVAFIDSDLTNPPEDLLKIGRAARPRDTTTSRRRASSPAAAWRRAALAAVLSVAGNARRPAAVRRGVSDVTNGFRAVRTDRLAGRCARRVRGHRRGARLGASRRHRAGRVPDRAHERATERPAPDRLCLQCRPDLGPILSTRCRAFGRRLRGRGERTMTDVCRSCREASGLDLFFDLGEMPLAGGSSSGPDEIAERAALPARDRASARPAAWSRSRTRSIPTILFQRLLVRDRHDPRTRQSLRRLRRLDRRALRPRLRGRVRRQRRHPDRGTRPARRARDRRRPRRRTSPRWAASAALT